MTAHPGFPRTGVAPLLSLIGDKDDFHAGDGADVAPKSPHVIDMQAGLITSATVKLHTKKTGELVENDVILYNQSTLPPSGPASCVVALHDWLGLPPEDNAVHEVMWNLAKTPLRHFSADCCHKAA